MVLLQGAAYYLGMLAYYWVLVTPSVGFLFGCYLYLSVNWFHVHYDEAFSSLQIPPHKGFFLKQFTPEGDLHIYGLAIDKVHLLIAFCLYPAEGAAAERMVISAIPFQPDCEAPGEGWPLHAILLHNLPPCMLTAQSSPCYC